MDKFCYLRLYLDNETVLYLLLLWMARMKLSQLFQVLMLCV